VVEGKKWKTKASFDDASIGAAVVLQPSEA